MLIKRSRRRRNVAFPAALLAPLALFFSPHDASAQDPVYVPPEPVWDTDIESTSMVLKPLTGHLALGLSSAVSTLQVYGLNVSDQPGSGYVVLGSHASVHMRLDRNDIQVGGGGEGTVAHLYLQRFGGPISVHGSQPIEDRIYISKTGDIGVATDDPRQYAIAQGFIEPEWDQPPSLLAVDGDAFSDRTFSNEGRFLERLRVGQKISGDNGGALDEAHLDAIAMIGGKLTAQEIYVHINKWSDDVFDEGYPLEPLSSVQDFIDREHHLPGVPSEASLAKSGLNLADADAILLRKIEELTLYAIAQEDAQQALLQRNTELESRVEALESEVSRITDLALRLDALEKPDAP